ncbi:MAG: protein-glutamate O-methyltransferase CheR, partial [Magnetococcales bacterium]|nr:protein-glutamate O-methyltransferase CheR [Magnetococcales bacterium]
MNFDPAPFQALIKARCGLACDGSLAENLQAALQERMRSCAVEPGAYLTLLQIREEEFRELITRITINETYFFREPEPLRLLVERLIPRLLAEPGRALPVRILSAGCASGEEPYSLVMALLEKFGPQVSRLFSFTGIDIDSTSLAKARQGSYGAYSFRGDFPYPRERYFDLREGQFLLKEPIKRLVAFRECNLLNPEIGRLLGRFDIVLFRNVSIYFDAPTRRIVLQNLASLLDEKAILLIGIVETLGND